MSEHNNDLFRPPQSVDELERQLSHYGPVIERQERAEAEIGTVFAARLRAHLVDNEVSARHPTYARNLRARLLRDRGARQVRRPATTSRRRSIGASVLATAALLGTVVFGALHGPKTQVALSTVPYPSRADLIFNFPSLPASIQRLAPTLSLIHPSFGVPFAGHLRLTSSTLPTEPSSLPAYTLRTRPDVMVLGRRILRLSSKVRHVMVDGTTWLVAADGGPSVHRPLHSLAVSSLTGELIYHDRRNTLLPHARRQVNEQRAVAIARTWLSRLGWPGNRMPLRMLKRVPNMPLVRSVVLSWPHLGLAATDAATLWVTPNGSVVEGWVWPVIAQHRVIQARSVASAWSEIREGRFPLFVRGTSPNTRRSGSGVLRDTRVVSVLTSGNNGKLYLVPAYRFTGIAHIAGATTTWYGLAPSAVK